MKFLGKLFAITVLLTGLNIHSFAYAAPPASTDNTQDKVSKKSPNIAADNGAKVKGTPAQSVEKISDNTKNVAADSSVNASDNQQHQININSANAEQLAQFLNGIGRKKAEAIITYREQSGPFTHVDQLLEVPGLGPSFLERNNGKIKL